MYDKGIERRGYLRRLRFACRTAFVCALSITAVHGNAFCRNSPNGLLMESVNPEADSALIARFRHRMDSIRTARNRPTVGLILSGGGAKGAAHVGAVKFLEEAGIPIDMIGGTSIGGLVGGLYALGYRADDLHGLFTTQDWDRTLSDRINHNYLPYDRVLYDSRYLLSLPIVRKTDKKNNKPVRGLAALTKSLPDGYVFGFNINNLLSGITVSYHDSLDFSTLPIPFFCVATDVVSGKEKNWGNGSIVTAMRSTMSIPGLFEPVSTDGMVLIDGGTRNNFPIDIARAIGVDCIIGVDISEEPAPGDDVYHVGDIFSRMISMLGQESMENNRGAADVLIKPDVREYGMLSFSSEAIDTLYLRGYRAAESQAGAIRVLKTMLGSDCCPDSCNAVDIRRRSVLLSDIVFTGISDKQALFLLKDLNLKNRTSVDSEIIEDAMARMMATGALSSVKYSLQGASEPYRLVFECCSSPIHRAGFGMRADTKEAVSLLFNIGINKNSISGSKLDLTAKLGTNQTATAAYSYESVRFPTVNVSADVRNLNISGMFSNKSRNDVDMWSHSEKIFLSSPSWKKFEVNGGFSNDYYGVKSILSDEFIYAKEDIRDNFRGDYLSVFCEGKCCTLDDIYFPVTGTAADIGIKYEFAQLSGKTRLDYSPYLIFSLDFKQVFPASERFSIIGDIHLRGVFGNNASHLGISNYVGGALSGRHFSQQIPFVGFDDTCLCYDNVAVMNLDFRYNAFRKTYLSMKAGLMKEHNITNEHGDLDFRPNCIGCAAEVAYDSVIGPVRAALRWSDSIGWGAYMSLGLDF